MKKKMTNKKETITNEEMATKNVVKTTPVTSMDEVSPEEQKERDIDKMVSEQVSSILNANNRDIIPLLTSNSNSIRAELRFVRVPKEEVKEDK